MEKICPSFSRLHEFGTSIPESRHCHNVFWKQVFKAYETYSLNIKPDNQEELLAEPVFYNKNILRDSSVIKPNQLFKNGYVYIWNFVDEYGHFLQYQNIQNDLPNEPSVDFLTFNGIRTAVREYVKRTNILIEDNKHLDVPKSLKTIIGVLKGAKLYYNNMMNDKHQAKCCSKWQDKLNKDLDWKTIFTKIHKIPDASLKWLQMRIVHRIIPTNIMLKSMRQINSDKCTFCEEERDSIEHFFVELSSSSTILDKF